MLTICTMTTKNEAPLIKDYDGINQIVLETVPTNDLSNNSDLRNPNLEVLNVEVNDLIPTKLKLKWYYYKKFNGYNFLNSNFSFSTARNLMLKFCKTKWALMLDADEELMLPNNYIEILENINSSVGRCGVWVSSWEMQQNNYNLYTLKMSRLINVEAGLKYKYYVHEDTIESLAELKLGQIDVPFNIIHNGYLDTAKNINKFIRNGSLLCKWFADNPIEEIDKVVLEYLFGNTRGFLRISQTPLPDITDYKNLVSQSEELGFYGVNIDVNIEQLLINIKNNCLELQRNYNNQAMLVNLYINLYILDALIDFSSVNNRKGEIT